MPSLDSPIKSSLFKSRNLIWTPEAQRLKTVSLSLSVTMVITAAANNHRSLYDKQRSKMPSTFEVPSKVFLNILKALVRKSFHHHYDCSTSAVRPTLDQIREHYLGDKDEAMARSFLSSIEQVGSYLRYHHLRPSASHHHQHDESSFIIIMPPLALTPGAADCRIRAMGCIYLGSKITRHGDE